MTERLTFTFHFHALEKEMATHSSVLAWRIPGWGSLVGCHLWGRTELDTTEATWQQRGLLRWLIGKEYTCNAGDAGLIPGPTYLPTINHTTLSWPLVLPFPMISILN